MLTQEQAQDAINTALGAYAQGTGQTTQQLQSRPEVQEAIDKALATATFKPPEDQSVRLGTSTTVANPLVPKEQADKLAREFVISGNFNVTGTDDPLGMVSSLIQREGVDGAIAKLQEQNINFYGILPKFDPGLADTVLRRMDSVVPNKRSSDEDPSFVLNKLALQQLGLDDFIGKYAKANKVSVDALKNTLEDIDSLNKQSEINLGAFKDQQFKQFQTNISDILAGKDPRRTIDIPKGLTVEDAVNQAFSSRGYNIDPEGEVFKYYVDYFNKYGIDTGISLLEDRLENMGVS